MEISKNYESISAEQKWYNHWMQKGYFHSTPDERPSYSIVMPPPNVTGVLHMGHALNNTVQDILIRRARMQGFNTCWVPGTDHASIATEAKVVNMLKEKGIDKNTLTREQFLEYAWQWKEEYGGIILQQLKKLGCSLDWDRTHFTLDQDYYKAVIHVFVDLYKKGFIYRGTKMINWDPQAKTALSDEEVIFKDTNSKLTYIQYQIEGTDEYITIATVRPETILGDTAICVHPEDPRYAHLKGKRAIVPLVNRSIPIIFDDYIDIEFGTGALKVTPAHDTNDNALGQKHGLEVIDILNADGTLSEAATMYVGEDRFVVRKKIVEALKESGNFVKQEDYKNQVGYSERTNVVIEPRISMQWWCNMEKLAEPALAAVMEEQIKFFPDKFKNLYRHWMTNIKDWCISRQLWWGQRIPAWYDKDNNIYVGETAEEAAAQYVAKYGGTIEEAVSTKLCQESDVLDTWFSSWLWPMEVFGWNADNNNEELAYYYPTKTLVTGPDIIFFWIARMIMSGYEYMKERPFDQVYFTGIVRDKQGRKMSKQLGNSPDLLKMIEDHGADVVRFSVLISSPAGNDILFDEAFLEQGRNFINKMWNAMKLVKMWEGKGLSTAESTTAATFATQWMQNRINEVRTQLDKDFSQFKLSEALKATYSLIWNDFCSWYIEWVKPGFEQQIDQTTYAKTIDMFEQLLQLAHPFMPFVTEEIYHTLREQSKDLINVQLPKDNTLDMECIVAGAHLQQVISAVRDARNKNNVKPKDKVTLHIDTANAALYEQVQDMICAQVNSKSMAFTNQLVAGAIAIVVGTDKIYVETEQEVDADAQKAKLEEELKYLEGFLVSVDKKLSNERFVQNAKPEIIDNERKKKADAEAKIQVLKDSIAAL